MCDRYCAVKFSHHIQILTLSDIHCKLLRGGLGIVQCDKNIGIMLKIYLCTRTYAPAIVPMLVVIDFEDGVPFLDSRLVR